ncbi:AAEL000027-PA [Aedes aegypti]|uniref:AAEL000027-PA n=2 Tax=Aedes aegypti TaxID=7159 RepID=Q0C761_AEDAE|nr:AAEL000027-PA [Aedes aegypti]
MILDLDRKTLWNDNNSMLAAINLGSTVFIVDENAALPFLDNFIRMHDEAMFRKPEKFVVVTVQSTSKPRITEILEVIQNHPAIQEIANLLLIVPSGERYELLTHRYVGNPPEALDLLLLDAYFPGNNSFAEGNMLFPNKLKDLMGKTYRLASFYLLPWVMPRQTDDGIINYLNQSYTIDGLDGYLLVLFCKRLNCTWDLLIDQYWQYGQVFENHTGNGMVGALVERKADFALAAVGAWHQLFRYFSFSIPIQWIGITCLQPRPTLIEYWKIIFMMFSTTVWAVLLVTFVLIAILDNYMPTMIERWSPNRRGISWSFINVLCSFLLLPSVMRRSRASEVMLSVGLSAFTLIVASVYIGKIHSILAIPVYDPPIDTIIDFAESKLRWNAPHEVWMYLIAESENPHIKQILTKFHVAPIPDLETIANRGLEPIVMAKLHFGHSMVGEWFTAENIENYRLMTDFLYYEYDTGYATKTWPLLGQFDHLSMWYRDGCLSRFVEQLDVFRYMNQRVQISIEHSRDRPPNKLKVMEVDEIEGGLLMLGIGYAAAILAFVGELVLDAAKRKKVAKRLATKWMIRSVGRFRLNSID